MVAYDTRWPNPDRRLSQETLDALADALRAQRAAGREPIPQLEAAIHAAAREATARAIPPESLLVQLKLLAEQAGMPPHMGDEGASALREWIVRACVAAYFAKDA